MGFIARDEGKKFCGTRGVMGCDGWPFPGLGPTNTSFYSMDPPSGVHS